MDRRAFLGAAAVLAALPSTTSDEPDTDAELEAVARYEPGDYPDRPVRVELRVPTSIADGDDEIEALIESIRLSARSIDTGGR